METFDSTIPPFLEKECFAKSDLWSSPEGSPGRAGRALQQGPLPARRAREAAKDAASHADAHEIAPDRLQEVARAICESCNGSPRNWHLDRLLRNFQRKQPVVETKILLWSTDQGAVGKVSALLH